MTNIAEHTMWGSVIHSRQHLYLPLIAGAVFLSMLLWLIPSGITYDSVYYLKAAHAWQSGSWPTDFNGNMLTWWPPLFSWVMALFPDNHFIVNHYYLYAVPAYLLYGHFITRWTSLLLNHSVKEFILNSLLLLGTPIILVFTFVWSESLFFVFFASSLYLFERNRQQPSTKTLILFTICVSCLSLTRLAGIIFIPAFMLYLPRKQWVLFTSSALPITILGFVNYYNTSTLFGLRPYTPDNIFNVLNTASTTVRNWFFPGDFSSYLSLACLIVLCVLFIYIAIIHQKLRPYIILFFVYTFFMTLVKLYKQLDPLDDRLLSPSYLLMFVVLIVYIHLSYTKLIPSILLIFLMLYTVSRTIKNSWFWLETRNKQHPKIEIFNPVLQQYTQLNIYSQNTLHHALISNRPNDVYNAELLCSSPPQQALLFINTKDMTQFSYLAPYNTRELIKFEGLSLVLLKKNDKTNQ